MINDEEHFTLTECGGVSLIEATESLIPLLLPGLIFACFWKIYVASKSPRVISLGLNEGSDAFEPLAIKQIRSSILFLYALVSLTTFVLGVFASRVFQMVQNYVTALSVK